MMSSSDATGSNAPEDNQFRQAQARLAAALDELTSTREDLALTLDKAATTFEPILLQLAHALDHRDSQPIERSWQDIAALLDAAVDHHDLQMRAAA